MTVEAWLQYIARRRLYRNLTSINDITNPVEAPARKYSDAKGFRESCVIIFNEQKKVAKLAALKNIWPYKGDSAILCKGRQT